MMYHRWVVEASLSNALKKTWKIKGVEINLSFITPEAVPKSSSRKMAICILFAQSISLPHVSLASIATDGLIRGEREAEHIYT